MKPSNGGVIGVAGEVGGGEGNCAIVETLAMMVMM